MGLLSFSTSNLPLRQYQSRSAFSCLKKVSRLLQQKPVRCMLLFNSGCSGGSLPSLWTKKRVRNFCLSKTVWVSSMVQITVSKLESEGSWSRCMLYVPAQDALPLLGLFVAVGNGLRQNFQSRLTKENAWKILLASIARPAICASLS